MPATTPAPLSPMFKWTGGKRREIERIRPYLPGFTTDGDPWRYVEPFVGGGALYFHFANPDSHINDWDADVMNFYAVAARADKRFLAAVKAMEQVFATGTHDDQDAAYYRWRNLDRGGGLASLPDWKRAARFYIVNQLAFSGMRRFNADGEFNVPFGHYKSFNAAVLRSPAHQKLLAGATLSTGDYAPVLAGEDNPRTFVFIDPPYTRVMKKYSAGNDFDDAAQELLRDRLVAMNDASWMVVIDESPLTKKLYKGLIAGRYPVQYGVNIKNRFSQAAHHLVATNY